MKNDTIPSAICKYDYQYSKVRQDLRNVVDTRLFTDRPAQFEQLERAGYVGGQTLKVRRPDPSEVGLSKSEIDHAIQYGITMDGKNE
jgi:hypothetical protein